MWNFLGEEPPESGDIQLPPKTPAASPIPSPKEVINIKGPKNTLDFRNMDFQLKPHLQKPDSAHSTTWETMIFHQTSLDICPTRQNHTFTLQGLSHRPCTPPSKFPLKENSFGKIELGAMQNEIEPCWTASKTRIWVKARLELKSQNWIWNWKTELKYSWISFYRGSENLSRSQTVTRNLCWKKLPNPQVEKKENCLTNAKCFRKGEEPNQGYQARRCCWRKVSKRKQEREREITIK